MTRTVRIQAFCSVKGGVGKSTLACLSAMAHADRGSVVVIDADLTGTSLADGLRLQAPDLPETEDGHLDLTQPPADQWLSTAEQEQRRAERRRTDDENAYSPIGIPYLNDALLYRPDDEEAEHDCRVDSMLWQMPGANSIQFFPSSPLRRDTDRILGYLYNEDHSEVARRLAWIIANLLELRPETTSIVLDLPPGLYGFSIATLALLAHIDARTSRDRYPDWDDMGIRWEIDPCLVVSEDSTDLFSSIEAHMEWREYLPRLRMILNRATTGREEVRRRVAERFPHLGRETDLEKAVFDHPKVRRIFIDRQINVPREDRESINKALRRATR